MVQLKTDQEKSWATKGIVTATAESLRSYIVPSESGVYRRNRRHLQTTADTEPSLPIPAPTTAPTTAPTRVPPYHAQPTVVSPSSSAPVTPQLRRSFFFFFKFVQFFTGQVRLYIAGLPLRSCPEHWATFCGGVPQYLIFVSGTSRI